MSGDQKVDDALAALSDHLETARARVEQLRADFADASSRPAAEVFDVLRQLFPALKHVGEAVAVLAEVGYPSTRGREPVTLYLPHDLRESLTSDPRVAHELLKAIDQQMLWVETERRLGRK